MGGDGGAGGGAGAADCLRRSDHLGACAPGVAITGATLAVDAAGLAEHCIVRGRADPRIGVDGRHYAIGFEMRLPLAWNGRFLHQVNGGNDGEVVPAIGDPHEMNAYGGQSALARGFAVLSSDEGHDGQRSGECRPSGLPPGPRSASTRRRATTTALPATPAWGRSAARSSRATTGSPLPRRYMMGCSNGGRHAMVAATRFGDRYDGFIAGDPGFDLPRAAIQHAWDVQNFRTVDPDIRKSFTPSDMALIARKVLEKCDALDGVADGMVNDLRACQQKFHLADLQCGDAAGGECLSAARSRRCRATSAGRMTDLARNSIPTGRSMPDSLAATGGSGSSNRASRPGTATR